MGTLREALYKSQIITQTPVLLQLVCQLQYRLGEGTRQALSTRLPSSAGWPLQSLDTGSCISCARLVLSSNAATEVVKAPDDLQLPAA